MESLISYRKKLAYNFLNPDCRFLFLTFHCPFLSKMLVLNLGHSPLYRHFCKCLYVEFYTFPRQDIVKASFALFIWLDGNAVKSFTCLLTIRFVFCIRQSENIFSLCSFIENFDICNPVCFMIFGCTLNVNHQSDSYWQASIWLSAHSLYAQQPCVC